MDRSQDRDDMISSLKSSKKPIRLGAGNTEMFWFDTWQTGTIVLQSSSSN